MLRALFPRVNVTGAVRSPGVLRTTVAALLQTLMYSALAYVLLGQALLERLGIAEPPFLTQARASQLYLLGGFFVCNSIAASLSSTGAYEVTLALVGSPPVTLHSKLVTGGVPSIAGLVQACVAAGLVPDPEAAAHFGLAQ